MKKIMSIIGVLAICVLFPLFSGCSSNKEYDKVISEIRDNVYTSTVDNWKFSAVSGEREKNYKIDGIANGREEFFILTVDGAFTSAPTCSFTIKGKEYRGTMKKHPFNNSYSYEINVKTDEKEVEVTVQCANDTITTTLANIKTEQTKTADQALNKAKSELKTVLDGHLKNGVFDGEIYIRLIPNPVENNGKYFWYVAFYKTDKECYSVLIDSLSGEIIATKSE